MKKELSSDLYVEKLYSEISGMILSTKKEVSNQFNQAIISLYWNIGKTLNEDVFDDVKPEYGKGVVNEISKKLVTEYGT